MDEQPYNQIALTEEQFSRPLATAGNSVNPSNSKQQNTTKTSGLIKSQTFSEQLVKIIASGINQERQLTAMAVSCSQKIALASFQGWVRNTQNPYESCKNFIRALKIRFASTQTKKRLRDKMHHLIQTSFVIQYVEEFMNLYTAIGSMTEEEAVDRFIRNPKEHARASVLVHNPQELLMAIQIAESYETASSRANYHKWHPPQHNCFQNNHLPQEDKIEVDSVNIRKLPKQKQKTEFHRLGLCFYWEVLEADIMLSFKTVDITDNNNQEQEIPTRFNHEHYLDFMDLQTPTPPLFLNVGINDRKYLALIDSGATTEMIYPYIVTEKRLNTEKLKIPIRITVADEKQEDKTIPSNEENELNEMTRHTDNPEIAEILKEYKPEFTKKDINLPPLRPERVKIKTGEAEPINRHP
ncbi:hypothetical protein BB560_002026, partial [Smittium megazygosporum]